MEQQRYSARRAFKYDGAELDRGQAMSLIGCENDEKLARLGFLTKLDPNQQLFRCRLCGAEFISERQRTKHGDRMHVEDPVEKAVAALEAAPVMTKEQGQTTVNRIMNDPDYEPALVPDETINSREKENEEEAPVFFDKTSASARSGAGAVEIVTPTTTAAEVPTPVMATPPPPVPGTTNDKVKPMPGTTSFDEGVKAAGRASAKGRIVPEPDENPHADPTEKGTFRDRKLLTGVDLKKWRTKKRLSRAKASEILGIGLNSIARAEKLRKHNLGSKLAPALSKALDST